MSDDGEHWRQDKPETVEQALELLRFGAVMSPIRQSDPVDQVRTERRMLACATFFEMAYTPIEVEVIDPHVMDLVRKHGSTMTNSEIVQKFLPLQKLGREPQSAQATAAGMKFCCAREEQKADEIGKLRNVIQAVIALPQVKEAWERIMGPL